jgi:hypothetical protein
MSSRKKKIDPERQAKILADARRYSEDREMGYREQALALFPHVCGRCCREFSGKTLRELTVHHKDHDHSNNPPDGSNWELLCLYCHDDEHQDSEGGGGSRELHSEGSLGNNPFGGLKGIIEDQEEAN